MFRSFFNALPAREQAPRAVGEVALRAGVQLAWTMGATSSRSSTSTGVLILGLDNAGKTSLLAQVLDEDARTVTPTLGFMLRGLVLSDGTQLKVWDVGGRQDVREHWRAHYAKAKCIIFVIDAVDRHRLQENSIELRRLLDQPRLVGLPLLLLANKQDVAGALPASEIEACLHLGTIRDRAWNCMGCSAFRGDGFVRGLKWLASQAGRSPTTNLKRVGSNVGQEDEQEQDEDEDDEDERPATDRPAQRRRSAANEDGDSRRRLRRQAREEAGGDSEGSGEDGGDGRD